MTYLGGSFGGRGGCGGAGGVGGALGGEMGDGGGENVGGITLIIINSSSIDKTANTNSSSNVK
jgi:hypothetical protein